MPPAEPSSSERRSPYPAPTRRSLVRRGIGAALGVGVAGPVLGAARADASGAAPRTAHSYRGAPLLPAAALRQTSRLSYGVTPALTAQVRAAGGADAWLARQLTPSRVPDAAAARTRGWWPGLDRTPLDLWHRQRDGVEGGWEVMLDYQSWLLTRRVLTNRQVAEVMAEFWMNHLHVPVSSDAVFTWRVDYDRTVRAHALGRFVDLLNACTVHPAMGMYLDNAVSTKDHPNENLGRELLELHTVGVGHYTEDDVKDSARILTGYRVDVWDTFAARYAAEDHWTGPVRVLGFRAANDEADGRAVVRAYLTYLARHRCTAERIARRLAVAFCSDTPSAALVQHLADVYQAGDTAIVPVLEALVASREFATSGPRVRDPGQDVVASVRALGIRLAPPSGVDGSVYPAMVWAAAQIGQAPHDWPRPDGQPITDGAWATPARVMASSGMHWNLAGRWWPSEDLTYRTPAQWLPTPRVRFDVLVDSLSQRLLARRSTPQLLHACTQICDVTPSTVIDVDHPLVRWNFHRLLSTLLDSPTHLTR